MKPIVYSKSNCMQCRMVKRLFESLSVSYDEVDVTEDEQALDFLKEKGFRSLPVTQFGEIFINGFQPEELQRMLS